MKSKTLKQFLAEKRKLDVQRAETVMDTLDKLTHVNDNSYCGSAVTLPYMSIIPYFPLLPSNARNPSSENDAYPWFSGGIA